MQIKPDSDSAAFIESVRRLLVKHSGGCKLQEDANGKAWPCGTCTMSILGGVIDTDAKEYKTHNKPVDRYNEIWRGILQMRDVVIAD